MEQKRTGLSYVFTLAKEERGKLSLGMLLAVFSSALSFVPYLVVYQILLLIIKQEVTLPAMLGWAGIGIAAAVLQAILTSFAGICSHTAAFNTMHRIKVRVIQLLEYLQSGKTYSVQELAELLHKDVGSIQVELEYLENQGYIRKVAYQADCNHNCNGCHGCDQPTPAAPDVNIWEVIKRTE